MHWAEIPVLLDGIFPQVPGNPDHHVITTVSRHVDLVDGGFVDSARWVPD